MNRIPITLDPSQYPSCYRSLLREGALYDSSCSETARVIFIEREGGLFLKSAARDTLRREAELMRFFSERGLTSSVIDYRTEGELDYLLTLSVPGEDGTHPLYLERPHLLADLLAESLWRLHQSSADGCPYDRMKELSLHVEEVYQDGGYDPSILHEPLFADRDDAFRAWEEGKTFLENDTLIHGDACLPNVLFRNDHFSGFVDLGNAGKGSRHVDLFWAIWSLTYNLKSDAYTERFLDAYGKKHVSIEALRTVAAMECFDI